MDPKVLYPTISHPHSHTLEVVECIIATAALGQTGCHFICTTGSSDHHQQAMRVKCLAHGQTTLMDRVFEGIRTGNQPVTKQMDSLSPYLCITDNCISMRLFFNEKIHKINQCLCPTPSSL
ncbi:hypothetical protein ILYODFUR_005424 [Ilyodon furcidens]|uniref:Uncharacterized protein n=1 Tax=Ilyodon furcidens TaxID=33524 RepID=A0ABV0UPM6_9TELE